MIYIIRRHNDFDKIRDITIGAFSTYERVLSEIREDMMENGYFEDAMNVTFDETTLDPFTIPCGLEMSAIRFPFGPNPFGRFYEIKRVTLDGE